MGSPEDNVTLLLLAWGEGDQTALEKLTPLVYDELRALARIYMARERAGHTLQASALVNEAYLRLANTKHLRWQNRAHFLGVSAQLMRRILVDSARARGSRKRGGEADRVTLDDGLQVSAGRRPDLVALDDALTALAAIDPRKAKVVELRFFGGLSAQESAEIIDVSEDTVLRDWKLAKVWLLRELKAAGRDAVTATGRGL